VRIDHHYQPGADRNWHEVIADPTIADAVLDRIVHNTHRLALKGDSMRKITAQRAILDATKKT
jgi:DNA replication protein DnaC